MLRCFVGLVILLSVRSVLACTAFFMFDGIRAIAGQNEDWIDPNTQIWFVPASPDSHAIVYFGFGKGRYPAGGISYPKSKILDLGIKDIAEITNTEDFYGFSAAGNE